jgi:hypothetical protein
VGVAGCDLRVHVSKASSFTGHRKDPTSPQHVKKSHTDAMPHGDFSDMAGFTCAGLGLVSIFAPDRWFVSHGPIEPMFDASAKSEPLMAAIQLLGAVFMFMFLCLFSVRWNVVNGKAGAVGCVIIAINAVTIALRMDDNLFKPRPWYLIAAILTAAAGHLAFNANPMLTSAMLLEKERAKASASKAM